MIIEKIKDYFLSDADYNFTAEITDTTSLIEAGVFDSFSLVKLVIFLEKAFQIKVEVIDLSEVNFSTLKNMENFIINKTKINRPLEG